MISCGVLRRPYQLSVIYFDAPASQRAALEHGGEGFHQPRIGVRDRRGIEARTRIELGIEVVIVVTQPLELVEILVVIDRRQKPADLAELLALPLAAERPVLDQRCEQIGLADGDELVAVVVGAPVLVLLLGGAASLGCRHCVA